MRKQQWNLMVLILLLWMSLIPGLLVIAQESDSAPQDDQTEDNETATEIVDPEAAEAADGSDGEDELGGEEQIAEDEISTATMERFNPSEDISADRSVAYPNDI